MLRTEISPEKTYGRPRNSSAALDDDAGADRADADEEEKATRPDLIYGSLVPHKGIVFRFAEVKYRRHLRTARSPDALQNSGSFRGRT